MDKTRYKNIRWPPMSNPGVNALFPPQYRPKYASKNVSLTLFLCSLLLIMGMDIELNPGPEVPLKKLTMVHMNIQSLYMSSIKSNPRVKIDEIISTFVVAKEVDIICISESWLHDQIDDDQINLPGYQKPYRRDRNDRRGGGACAYVTNNILSNRLKTLEPPDIDLIWFELKLTNKKVVIGVGYRPPGQNQEEADRFMEQFSASLTSVMARNPESIIIMGDLNDTCTKWDSIHVNSDLKNDLYDLVNVLDMVQLVNEPTHILSTSQSCIDIVITDSPGYVVSLDLLPPLGSKHVSVYMEFEISYPRDKNFMRHVWDYDKGNYDGLNEAINGYQWNDFLSTNDDVDYKTNIWTDTFLSLCKNSIPNRDIKVRPRDLPWITNDCKHLIRIRNRLYKKFQRTRSEGDELTWKNKAREVRVALNLAKLNHRQKLMDTLSKPGLEAKKY